MEETKVVESPATWHKTALTALEFVQKYGVYTLLVAIGSAAFSLVAYMTWERGSIQGLNRALQGQIDIDGRRIESLEKQLSTAEKYDAKIAEADEAGLRANIASLTGQLNVANATISDLKVKIDMLSCKDKNELCKLEKFGELREILSNDERKFFGIKMLETN